MPATAVQDPAPHRGRSSFGCWPATFTLLAGVVLGGLLAVGYLGPGGPSSQERVQMLVTQASASDSPLLQQAAAHRKADAESGAVATQVHTSHLQCVSPTGAQPYPKPPLMDPNATYLHCVFGPSKEDCPPNLRRNYTQTKLAFAGEFGYELQIPIPYAYYLMRECFTAPTYGKMDTAALYFFSPNHTQGGGGRDPKNHMSCCPFAKTVHTNWLNSVQLRPPPYKKMYANTMFDGYKKHGRPFLVIVNKFGGGGNIKGLENYIPVATLARLVSKLQNRFTIVYTRFDGKEMGGRDVGYNGVIAPERDREELKALGVLLFQDLMADVTALAQANNRTPPSLNLMQLLLYANADHFVCVMGGNAVFNAYMAGADGRVAVLVRSGHEHHTHEVDHWYSFFSGATVRQFDEVVDLEQWVVDTY